MTTRLIGIVLVSGGIMYGTMAVSCGDPPPRQAPQQKENRPSLIGKVEAYRKAVKAGDTSQQQALLSPDARRWFDTLQGDGSPVKPGKPGPWHAWDTYFKSSSIVESSDVHGDTVAMRIVETNDFYRLISRDPVPMTVRYFFDSTARITGMLISRDAKPKDRFEEFKRWAARNRPDDLKYLMPEGEIIPDMDRARKWRAILSEWRAQTGLPPLN